MAQPLCIVVPGLMGSHLAWQPWLGPKLDIWLNYLEIRTLQIAHLALNAAGSGPLGTAARDQLVPRSLLNDYFGELIVKLRGDFFVVDHPYDWRLTIPTNGAGLAARILTEFANQDCYIVAHSLGGLVARSCWKILKDQNKEGQIKRIVTVGTPHWGAYGTPMVFTRLDTIYKSVLALMEVLNPLAVPTSARNLLDTVAASWPSLYELFPFLQDPFANQDPERAAVHQAATWQPINPFVRANRLSFVAGVHQSLVAALPPASVMVSVRGRGRLTAFKVANPEKLDKVTGYLWGEGDGAVSEQANTLEGRPYLAVNGTHAALTRHPQVLDALPQLLFAGLSATQVLDGPRVD